MSRPRIIALCGNPGAGKSTAQNILHAAYGYQPVDDGLGIRQIAVEQMGLTWDQVTTQAGKREKVMLNDREWVVRDVLGELGNALEEKFGPDIIPLMAYRANNIELVPTRNPPQRYSFGSVRREQGWFHKKHGGLVIEIRNPQAPVSPYAFDAYNPMAVDGHVDNDGLSRGLSAEDALKDLSAKLTALYRQLTPDE